MREQTQNEKDKLIRESYHMLIKYYWSASKSNKKWAIFYFDVLDNFYLSEKRYGKGAVI
jgi:hypothetical protein